MGFKYEVLKYGQSQIDKTFRWESYYYGDSLLKAIWIFVKVNKKDNATKLIIR